ncbi:MAG TPA: sigma factor-like helix-turn-helix DNA-binding protein [Candidatus Saccharimonadales bacterium]|nr:sigma factor-like helix-turn-helix DNA-binding protein [Candidatus Saccharimonadales bacterium]
MLSVESLLGWIPGRSPGSHPPLSPDAQNAARRLIVDTLPRLDEKRRLVLALRYYEELTVEEIARTLGLDAPEVQTLQDETVCLLQREIQRRLRAAGPAGGARRP